MSKELPRPLALIADLAAFVIKHNIHRIYQPVAALVLLFLALSRARQRHNAASPLRSALAA